MHGQAGVHRLHPLRSPGGVWRLRRQPAPLPHLQGRHPGQRPCLHVLRLKTKTSAIKHFTLAFVWCPMFSKGPNSKSRDEEGARSFINKHLFT